MKPSDSFFFFENFDKKITVIMEKIGFIEQIRPIFV